ncbi:low molecular weight neuronal intermediate filament isoform X3 [Gambusia affinis]|uniref:low molecular weight neuronal intermediate filament isoform X3 n=1 Tax=Gambusia affinis TaxID=33528 RepID=UPI001CDC1C33|nr:low molecular weight neuronal intermediate filament isoform X3 [Gambusia affinis]
MAVSIEVPIRTRWRLVLKSRSEQDGAQFGAADAIFIPTRSGAMAMLRVSSYRRLFDYDRQSPNGGPRLHQASARCASADKCGCDKIDLVTTKALNKADLDRFVQERTTMAALNDRLVKLIELAHCLEEENGSLECQIADLEENLNGQPASTEITSTAAKPKFSLEAVVEKLRRQRDEIICDTEELKEELECLQKEFEKAAHQRIVVQQGQQDAAEAVDAVTAECLALRDQVAVYKEQLANMETQHKMEVESQLQPDERALAAAVVRFGSPDITPVWEVKEYHRQLAESLQLEFGALSSGKSDGKKLEARGTGGSMVKDPTEITDVDEMKTLISELQKELDDLEKSNEELLDEVEFTITEMKQQEVDFKSQMKEQCEEYRELLGQKMARDMEIAAYRTLVEEEEVRLCSLSLGPIR